MQYAYLEETSLGSGSFNIQTSDTTGVNLFDGNWHHIVVTFEGTTTIKIYDNTVLVGDFTIINTLQYDPHNFTLGTSTTNSLNLLDIDTFEGVMDEVRTYDKVLTPEQITTLYEYYDGVQTDIIIRDLDSTAVITPTNQITTMLDITSLEGTPVVIYKYLGIDESVVRWIT
ncbi:MAG: hypothetical protein DRN30_06255 [Thermoplasmata archaeon]|nr:MAG: hypothetical protein DRN30_06255 [Thermoplasmata archaeon]